MSINRVIVTGNLTRDPELRQAGSSSVLQMRLAVNDRRRNAQTDQWEDVPNYFDVIVWGQRGESLSRFLSKGSKIAVAGRLRWSEWQNQEGEKRSKVEIVADDVEFMSTRDGGGSAGRGGYDAPAAPAPAANGETFAEDIPF